MIGSEWKMNTKGKLKKGIRIMIKIRIKISNREKEELPISQIFANVYCKQSVLL